MILVISEENFRKKEWMQPKQKQHPVVNVTGDGSKVRCSREHIAQEPGMFGPRIKANWKWSNSRWQHRRFRNQ